MEGLKITNVVCSGDLQCALDLKDLASNLPGMVKYDRSKFSALRWRDGVSYLLFHTGKFKCLGISDLDDVQPQLDHCTDVLKKLGYKPIPAHVKVDTITAVYDVRERLDLKMLHKEMDASYEPEIFPAAIFKRAGINYTCHHTGKVVIMSIKSEENMIETVWPTLIEISLCTVP